LQNDSLEVGKHPLLITMATLEWQAQIETWPETNRTLILPWSTTPENAGPIRTTHTYFVNHIQNLEMLNAPDIVVRPGGAKTTWLTVTLLECIYRLPLPEQPVLASRLAGKIDRVDGSRCLVNFKSSTILSQGISHI